MTSEERNPQERLVPLFHGHVGDTLRSFTTEPFQKPESVIRVFVSTTALGMDVEVGDIGRVVHWSKSRTILTHWQEVGRCRRDGITLSATWYPKSTAGDDHKLFEKGSNLIHKT